MIKVTGKSIPKVKDTGRTLLRVEPEQVGKALGASSVTKKATQPQGPLSLFALRQGLAERLRSTGGRPGLGEMRRQKIPLSDADWELLVQLAQEVTSDGMRPTAGQLASEILHQHLLALRERQGIDSGR